MLLVVDDRDRDDIDILRRRTSGSRVLIFQECVDQVAQHTHARRPQLAGSGATTLEVPLKVRVFAQQEAQIQPHHRGVDRVVSGVAADEDEPRALGQHRCGPHSEVGATQDEVGREALLGQHPTQDQRIEVGAMVGQKDQGVLEP